MTLLQTRDRFLEASGRLDLGVIGGADTGANKFINAGQKLLDRLQDTPTSFKRFQFDTTTSVPGNFTRVMQLLRSIQQVWLSKSDGRVELQKISLEALRKEFAKPIATLTTAEPKFYAPAVINLSPEQDTLTSGNFTGTFTYDFEDIQFADTLPYDKTGIVFFPPADAVYTISVFGKFFSNPLLLDTDRSYWTEVDEELLVFAAMYQLEVFYRNTEGSRDWMNAILLQLKGIDDDLADEEAAGVNQMRG